MMRYTTLAHSKPLRETSRIEVVPNDRIGKEFLVIRSKHGEIENSANHFRHHKAMSTMMDKRLTIQHHGQDSFRGLNMT